MSCNRNSDCTSLVGIPGARGRAGQTGNDGFDGSPSFALTTADFTMPAEGGTVVLSVTDNGGFAVGGLIFVQNAGTFQITSKTGNLEMTVLNLEDTANDLYPDNATPGTVIALGQQVAPTGRQGVNGTTPGGGPFFEVANNLIEGNPATMRSNLGLGTMAVQNFNNISVTGGNIQDVGIDFTNAALKKNSFNNLSPLTTLGDLLTFDGTDNVRLPVGANGRVLTVSGGIPAWVAPTASSGVLRNLFRAHKNGVDQTFFFGGAGTLITFATEDFDADNVFAASVFTAPAAGYYDFTIQCTVTPGASSQYNLRLYKNGAPGVGTIIAASEITPGGGPEPIFPTLIRTGPIPLSLGDTVACYGQYLGGVGNVTFDGTSYLTWFSGYRVA